MQKKTTTTMRTLFAVGVLAAAPLAHASWFAGDTDDFGDPNDPNDTIILRDTFEAWLDQTGNNTDYHNGESMPFDIDEPSEGDPFNGVMIYSNWHFGYTFEDLPSLPQDAMLRIRLKGLNGSPGNDSLRLMYTGDGTQAEFAYSINLGSLQDEYFGDGTWDEDDVRTFEVPLNSLPLGGGDTNLIDNINAAGYLDVCVTDDTGVDWINLVPAPGTASLLLLAGLAGRQRRD